MAHQFTRYDEHIDGTINQYYRRNLSWKCRRSRIRRIRHCEHLLPGTLYARFRLLHRTANYGRPKKRRAEIQRNRQNILSGIILLIRPGSIHLPIHTSHIPVSFKANDSFTGNIPGSD